MGLLGQQNHPDLVAAVNDAFTAIVSAGKPFGVNAFDTGRADFYTEDGARFLLVGADAAILARGQKHWPNAVSKAARTFPTAIDQPLQRGQRTIAFGLSVPHPYRQHVLRVG
ncbi:hypothetical protein E4P29_25635 [Rhodococcus sp. 1R11]|nr:hypothetical protein [Rhodococcus sp. 1R11]TFI40200.1 hypothetical protein E4P29_25635 [Rhodococcus sp. 1R11]